MKIKALLLTAVLAFSILPACAGQYDKVYSGKELDHIAYPIGGLGSGMFCISGNGAISNMSFHHYPQLFHEPCTFSAIHVKGYENNSKVLESAVPDYKIFGRNEGGMGVGGTTWGLPRFQEGTFSARFPFAEINLK
ncbi:MAG: GH116 family glycosyl-hydrolase, partial [Bacteroidales bacterium]|nr:GH116 family glycosyl-hydrolase [Bacteroidales bacterium]